MSPTAPTPSRLRRCLVIGGGCYGSHYVDALLRARRRERIPEVEIWIIDGDQNCLARKFSDRDSVRLITQEWSSFFEEYLSDWKSPEPALPGDLIIPSPLTPHLFVLWLRSAIGRERVTALELPALPTIPFARNSGGASVLSFAEWRCPTHCVEPHVCPATRQPRDWDISSTLLGFSRELRRRGHSPLIGPLLARCTHWVEGVGVFPLGDWIRAAQKISESYEASFGYALVGTVSGCHGITQLLEIKRRDQRSKVTRACQSDGPGITSTPK